MNTLLFSLIDFSKLRPENIFGGQVIERTPAGLTIVYSIGVGILLAFLLVSFLENFRRPKLIFERELPREVNRKIAQTRANRSMMVWLSVFIILALFVYGFQVYWTRYADDTNEQFQALSYKDLRNRRVNAASLRGWMLDRTGKLDAALAYYKVDKDGSIVREFPLDKEMAHLLGTERGSPGLERTLYKKEADPMPEAWEILTKYKKPEPENKDVRVTIDKELQAYSAKQLEGKHGAVVVLNPQTGDLLAMYSNPSFSLDDVKTNEGYLRLEANKRDEPLLSRAMRQYYMPGSTFKTVTMMTAFRTGKQGILLPDPHGGYVPFAGSRAIHDAGGECEDCRDQVPIRDAFQKSLNEVFARMANELGREPMANTARLLGIAAVEDPDDALKQGYFPDIWNVSDRRIAAALAPARATMVTGKKITAYDFGLEGMGQGYASQMTPFQMALVAATAGNLQGFLMKPKVEADLPPQPFNKVLTPEQGAAIRDIMGTVTQEGGTAGRAIQAAMRGTNIVTGGKTGTANKDSVPIYVSETERKFTVKQKKNANGEMVDYKEYWTRDRIDGWFICIAPLENPQIAIALVVEDIPGHAAGGTTAAPIVGSIILKAAELGLLGDRYKSVAAPRQSAPKKKKK